MAEARLHVIPGGFSHVSDGLRLDLSRYGIIARQAAPMPTRTQRRLVGAIEAVCRDLGFEPDSDSADLLPPQGGTLAVHPVVKTWDAALLNMAAMPVSEEPSGQEIKTTLDMDAASSTPEPGEKNADIDEQPAMGLSWP